MIQRRPKGLSRQSPKQDSLCTGQESSFRVPRAKVRVPAQIFSTAINSELSRGYTIKRIWRQLEGLGGNLSEEAQKYPPFLPTLQHAEEAKVANDSTESSGRTKTAMFQKNLSTWEKPFKSLCQGGSKSEDSCVWNILRISIIVKFLFIFNK